MLFVSWNHLEGGPLSFYKGGKQKMEIEKGSGADLGSSSNECAQVPEIRYMMD